MMLLVECFCSKISNVWSFTRAEEFVGKATLCCFRIGMVAHTFGTLERKMTLTYFHTACNCYEFGFQDITCENNFNSVSVEEYVCTLLRRTLSHVTLHFLVSNHSLDLKIILGATFFRLGKNIF